MLQDLIDCGAGPGVEGHGSVEDVDHLLGNLREHLVEPLLLPDLQALQVLLGVLVREELQLLWGGLAEGGEDHRQLVVATLRVPIYLKQPLLL